MGVTQDNDSGNGKALLQIPSFTLGTNNITPVAMAEAYATLASGGTYCKPYAITGVTDASGKQYRGAEQTVRAGSGHEHGERADVPAAGRRAVGYRGGSRGPGRPSGRGQDRHHRPGVATWFDGYTPQLATAVWTGYINWNTKTKMENIQIGPKYFSGQVFGASISAPIFNDAMTGALSGVPAVNFTAPTGFDNTGNSQNQGTGTATTGGVTGTTGTTGTTTGATTGNGAGNENGTGGNTGLFGGIFGSTA